MIWELLGHVNGKTLLIAIIAGVVGFVLVVRPDKEDDQ
jgi:hypothetical protein